MFVTHGPIIERDAPVPTWFGIGGAADALARPATIDELRDILPDHQRVRVLGDGANLLVDDDGVDGLVVSLQALAAIERPDPTNPGLLRVGAGANLPRLVVDTVREGLAGLEALGGVPATLGGAIAMNAGGAFGQIADVVERVFALTRLGDPIELRRGDIAFGYRHSGLRDLVITGADLRLRRTEDPGALRERLKEVMAYKKASQPMADRSAGCVFKNPSMPDGNRESAGRLIDRAGLKGLRVGGAMVSPVHANFVVTERQGALAPTARDVLRLMREVRRRVRETHGIELEPEIAVWTRNDQPWEELAS